MSLSSSPLKSVELLPDDVQDFLANYPNQASSESLRNVEFYKNVIPMRPDNIRVSTALKRFKGNHTELESNHGYIQWFFPIRQLGVNHEACPMTLQERDIFRTTPPLQGTFREFLDIMFDFYGFRVCDHWTLRMERTPGYVTRYMNLLNRPHNFLRITRILKSCSEVGLEQYNVPILLWFLHEQSQGELNDARIKTSMDMYWIHCVRDLKSRAFVAEMTKRVRGGYVLGYEEYAAILKQKRETNVWRASWTEQSGL